MDLARERDDAYEKLYVELPEGFTTITANMFGDIQIKELYIPVSVTKIEEGAFGAQIYLQIFVFLRLTKVQVAKWCVIQ